MPEHDVLAQDSSLREAAMWFALSSYEAALCLHWPMQAEDSAMLKEDLYGLAMEQLHDGRRRPKNTYR
eukprot:2598099-Pleurochrysis_carterae.AAC.1